MVQLGSILERLGRCGAALRNFGWSLPPFGIVLFVTLMILPVGEQALAATPTKLLGGLIEVSVPSGVRMTKSGSSFIFRAAGEDAYKMQLTLQRVSRPGLKYAGELYNATYEQIKKAGGYRVTGETSSGPSTGESCEIRYLIKAKADRSRLHQVREHYTKIRGSEWVKARLSARSSVWNSRPAKMLRSVLSSVKLGGR